MVMGHSLQPAGGAASGGKKVRYAIVIAFPRILLYKQYS